MRFGFRDVYEKVEEGRESLPVNNTSGVASLPNKVSLPKETDKLPEKMTLRRNIHED